MSSRVKNLQLILTQQKIDALLISNAYNITYLTGITHFSPLERDAFVLVSIDTVYIFTDSRYTGGLQIEKGRKIVECSTRSTFYQQLKDIVRHNKWTRVGYEESNLTVKEFNQLKKSLDELKKENGVVVRLLPTPSPIENLRGIKDTDEIESLRKASRITDAAFSEALKVIRKNVTEKELAYSIDAFIRQQGANPAFPTIVAFGKNAAIPHHHTGSTRLSSQGTGILMDFGAQVNGYCADMSRTVFFGKVSTPLEQQYRATQHAQLKAIESLEKAFLSEKKKIAASEVTTAALEVIKKSGFPAFPHALGHGVGLEVHELPIISQYNTDDLLPGMAITIEPGIYILGKGGVRIEDTIVLSDNGIEILTQSSKSIIIR